MVQPCQTTKPEIVVHQRSGRSSGFANLGQTFPELRRESDGTRCTCEPTFPHQPAPPQNPGTTLKNRTEFSVRSSWVVAETFCNPEHFAGTRRRAGVPRGLPAGAAPTPMARRFSLCGATAAVAGGGAACLLAPRGSEVMRSLHDELAAIEDFRHAGSTRCAHVLAELANMKGSCAVCAVAVPGRGHRRNPRTELREPPSGATLHRVVRSIDPEALEDVLGRGLARALAADGKRIRGGHHETVVTPPAHPSRC